MELISGILSGDRRALARAISLIEDNSPRKVKIIKGIYDRTGRAHVIGVTGPPGVGKSTLVRALIERWRGQGRKVGVIAVDPSSPFTGGAILGDRLRMLKGNGPVDDGVFIRSLATRGSLGGLSGAAADAVKVLDAAGYPVILVETVGTGQSEVDVMNLVQTTVVVTVPGLGDDIQAIKAGIMEIGDLFVVNKADLPGAARALREIEINLALAPGREWRPRVLEVSALQGRGVEQLVSEIESHRRYLEEAGLLTRLKRRAAERELRDILTERLVLDLLERKKADGSLDDALGRMERGLMDPYTAAESLLEEKD